MSLAVFGLEGLVLHPRVSDVLSKLAREVNGLKREKRERDASNEALNKELRRLQGHATTLEDTLQQTSDALSRLQIARSRETKKLSDKNHDLKAKVRNLEAALHDVRQEKDNLVEALEELVEHIEASDANEYAFSYPRVSLQAPLAPLVRNPTALHNRSTRRSSTDYAASLIASLTTRLEATREELDMLQEGSDANISVLEAQVAHRDAQIYGFIVGAHEHNDRGATASAQPRIRRPRPREADSAAGNTSIRELSLEEDVRRITEKLEQVELLTSQVTNSNTADLSRVSDQPPLEHPTTLANAEPANPQERFSDEGALGLNIPRSPRFLAVLHDLEEEIARLSGDLAELRSERERVLSLGRTPSVADLSLQDDARASSPIVQSQYNSLMLEGEGLRVRQTDESSRQLLSDLLETSARQQDDSDLVDPGSPATSTIPLPYSESITPIVQTVRDPMDLYPDPRAFPAYAVRTLPHHDLPDIRRQLDQAEDALLAEGAQLEKLQADLESLLARDKG